MGLLIRFEGVRLHGQFSVVFKMKQSLRQRLSKVLSWASLSEKVNTTETPTDMPDCLAHARLELLPSAFQIIKLMQGHVETCLGSSDQSVSKSDMTSSSFSSEENDKRHHLATLKDQVSSNNVFLVGLAPISTPSFQATLQRALFFGHVLSGALDSRSVFSARIAKKKESGTT